MKVKELIEALSSLDPEMMVVRKGYEGGMTEVNYVSTMKLALNVNEDWFYGEHEQVSEFSYEDLDKFEKTTAVFLT